jgi:hypothetical protein
LKAGGSAHNQERGLLFLTTAVSLSNHDGMNQPNFFPQWNQEAAKKRLK